MFHLLNILKKKKKKVKVTAELWMLHACNDASYLNTKLCHLSKEY